MLMRKGVNVLKEDVIADEGDKVAKVVQWRVILMLSLSKKKKKNKENKEVCIYTEKGPLAKDHAKQCERYNKCMPLEVPQFCLLNIFNIYSFMK